MDGEPGQGDGGVSIPLVRARLRAPPASGLPRERLTGLLASIWEGRLALVTGPAGSGKTTLLAQYAASVGAPIVWYQAEAADGDPRRLLAHVREGLVTSLGSTAERWDSVDAAIAAMEDLRGQRVLLVIDDIQTLEGTGSEAAVERLVWFAPPGLGVVIASRSQPGLNLSRLRVADRLVEIDADALRFRSWEVERLFHDVYQEPLHPVDLATLARRTQGWAAGLQLFHLASRGKNANERRQMVHNLSSRSRLVREYLTQNVVDELPVELRRFLIDTCVLGLLTGSLCDALLSRTGSAAVLEEIARRQIFLCPIDDGASFRYHEVLRSHLEACLVDQIGEQQARRRYARAGALLEAGGACSEALWAYCRASDEASALRLLSRSGAAVADDRGAWFDLLPSGLIDHDPWLLLATARRHLAAGRWRQAVTSYQQAEASFSGPGGTCRRERMTVAGWLDPATPMTADWVGAIRQATKKDPLGARRLALTLPGPNGQLATGLAALLAGQLHDARDLLRTVSHDADASPAVAAGASLAAGVAGLLIGDERAAKELHEGREHAEDLGLTWLAWLAGCAELCLGDTAPGGARATAPDPEDRWGAALFGLLQGLGAQDQPDAARRTLVDSAGIFRGLGAGVLEAWALAAAAMTTSRSGHPDSRGLGVLAETAARATSAWGALAATFHATALSQPDHARELIALAVQLDVDQVIQLTEADAITTEARTPATVTCFGEFSFALEGRKIDLAGVKPRVRSLMRVLVLNSGRAVHRETLIEALWPGANTQTGTRNLQVAISAARRLVEHAGCGGALILREGDAYRLILPEGAVVDVRSFDDHFERARRARTEHDRGMMRQALARCLDLYRGDVLAVEGPAEWVLEVRERYRVQAADVSEALAETYLADGAYAEAVRVCERGLAIDRYRDQLWRLRAEALDASGDLAAGARARHSYGEMLRELGVTKS